MIAPDDSLTSWVWSLEQRRFAAMTACDTDELDRLCSPRLLYTHATSVRDTKATYLDKFRAGYYSFGPITATEKHACVGDGFAVVTGDMAAQLVAGGVRRRLHTSYTAVWVVEGGAWQFLSYQSTSHPSGDTQRRSAAGR